MALIACTECGKQISSNADACPNCGHKLSSFAKLRAASQGLKAANESLAATRRAHPEAAKLQTRKGLISLAFLVLGGLAFFGFNQFQVRASDARMQSAKAASTGAMHVSLATIRDLWWMDPKPVSKKYLGMRVTFDTTVKDIPYSETLVIDGGAAVADGFERGDAARVTKGQRIAAVCTVSGYNDFFQRDGIPPRILLDACALTEIEPKR